MSEDRYTVVFNGDIREMGKNLFKVISPFGEVVACGVGNEFARADDLAERLDAFEMDGASAAHEITRLRAELAAEREAHEILLAERNTRHFQMTQSVRAERDALRAELAAMERRARTFEAANVKILVERDALRALLREAREELDELAETNDVMMLKRKKLRELLREVVASIDALLTGGGK